MKRVGRVVVSQECLADFFAHTPEGWRILDVEVTQFRMLPPELEFVIEWNGFDSIPDECIPPLYEATKHENHPAFLFKRA